MSSGAVNAQGCRCEGRGTEGIRGNMRRRYWKPEQLILVGSDQGDAAWSLHAPWATADQIAGGDDPPLQSGTTDFTWDGKWAGPDRFDYARAMDVLSAADPTPPRFLPSQRTNCASRAIDHEACETGRGAATPGRAPVASPSGLDAPHGKAKLNYRLSRMTQGRPPEGGGPVFSTSHATGVVHRSQRY
jgi:hypothetical protein